MIKRIIAVLLLVTLVGGILAACEEKKAINANQAVQLVAEDLKTTADKLNPHVHEGTNKGEACYFVYITHNGESLVYVVSISSGEIVTKGRSEHSH